MYRSFLTAAAAASWTTPTVFVASKLAQRTGAMQCRQSMGPGRRRKNSSWIYIAPRRQIVLCQLLIIIIKILNTRF